MRAGPARKVYQLEKTRVQNGQVPPPGFSAGPSAERALRVKKDDRVEALRAHLDRTREVERMTRASARAGSGLRSDAEAATYFRLEAEIRLAKEGVKAPPAKEREEKTETP